MIRFTLNGEDYEFDGADDTPLLWRCQGCACAFLTPAMLAHLANYRWTDPGPPGLLDRLRQ